MADSYSWNEKTRQRVLDLLPKLRDRKVLVVGDIGLDEYVMGQVRRISPEAPVPVVEVEVEDFRLGLAAFVAQSVLSLGGQVKLLGVVGDDRGAHHLKELFLKTQVPWDDLVVDQKRPTTRKARIMAKSHHVVRIDYELKNSVSAEVEAELVARAEILIPQVDTVILEDYAKGVVTRSLVQSLVQICRKNGKLLLVDPTRTQPAEFYQGVDWIKPNYDEAIELTKVSLEDLRLHPEKVDQLGPLLKEKTQCRVVILTRGAQGMTLFKEDGSLVHIPTYAKAVFDVTGAGDTVIAAMALGAAAKLSLEESALIANCAAGIVVTKVGCVPCDLAELKASLEEPWEVAQGPGARL